MYIYYIILIGNHSLKDRKNKRHRRTSLNSKTLLYADKLASSDGEVFRDLQLQDVRALKYDNRRCHSCIKFSDAWFSDLITLSKLKDFFIGNKSQSNPEGSHQSRKAIPRETWTKII